MANYDQAAFQYPNISTDYNSQATANTIGIAPISEPGWNATMQYMVNAFGTFSGGGPGNPSDQDINGYGYSHSG